MTLPDFHHPTHRINARRAVSRRGTDRPARHHTRRRTPTPGQILAAPGTLTLTASAADPDNNLATVAFQQNGNLITTLTNPPYAYSWANVAQGSYVITATATDAVGAQTTSDPVTITVTSAQGSVYYLFPDQIGTTRLITNEQNQIVWRNLPTTEPFGNTPPEENPTGLGVFKYHPRFPGQYADSETGTNYNYFRDYNPATGGYIQSDPIGLDGGQWSTYAYVNGNPVSRTDPYGLGWGNSNEGKDLLKKVKEALCKVQEATVQAMDDSQARAKPTWQQNNQAISDAYNSDVANCVYLSNENVNSSNSCPAKTPYQACLDVANARRITAENDNFSWLSNGYSRAPTNAETVVNWAAPLCDE